MRRALVTGAGGYVGSVLVSLLIARGYEFTVHTLPDVPRLSVLESDTRALDASVLKAIDAVVDLAALSNGTAGELDVGKAWDISHRGHVRIAMDVMVCGNSNGPRRHTLRLMLGDRTRVQM